MNKIKGLVKSEKGQGIVEFAIVLWPLMLIVLGMVEFGWLFNAKITLTSSAREGARIAAVSNLNHEAKARSAVENAVLGTSGLTITDVDYSTEKDYVNDIRNVIIKVEAEVDPIIGLFVTDPQTMEAIAKMRIE